MNSLNKSSETLLLEIKLQDLIKLELPDSNLYFDFTEDNLDYSALSLVTISRNHGERFLFHKTEGNSRVSCLREMLDYIKSDYKKKLENYEILWANKSDMVFKKSWFCGNSFIDIMDKFFYMKDTSEIRVLEVKLMPIS